MTKDQTRMNTTFNELLDRYDDAQHQRDSAAMRVAFHTRRTSAIQRAQNEDKLAAAEERVQRLREGLIDAYVTALVREDA